MYETIVCPFCGKGHAHITYDDDRLEQLCAAEKDGRCGVCPVKLHQHIFRIFNGQILEEVVCSAIFEPFTPRPRWKIYVMGGGLPYYWYDVIGKAVFLTRPEADAALEKMKEDSNGT